MNGAKLAIPLDELDRDLIAEAKAKLQQPQSVQMPASAA